MFKDYTTIFAHRSIVSNGSFVGANHIISKNNILLNRYCPHRKYPLGKTGDIIDENIVCKFHGFEWTTSGNPINNTRNINCGLTKTGKSGLLFNNFIEPDSMWVSDLENETNLIFSHIFTGTSTGSCLWMMDVQVDLLHIRKGEDVIHPSLSAVTNLNEVQMINGNDWVLQTHTTGWWLIIYPFTFIEWSKGCLCINYLTPNNINEEFGFTWMSQFYYNKEISIDKRKEFETLEDVFKEDVAAIEQQKTPYFPLTVSSNRLEDHCLHFGQWIKKNRITK